MKLNIADVANLSLLELPRKLERKLEDAEVVLSGQVPPDVVTMQCRAVLADTVTGRRRRVTLVNPSEADSAAGRISVLDALGAELLGASTGDIVHAVGPGGPCSLRVEKILYQPERSMREHIVVRP
jgi:regulator of nucleoside diphosphate kinase